MRLLLVSLLSFAAKVLCRLPLPIINMNYDMKKVEKTLDVEGWVAVGFYVTLSSQSRSLSGKKIITWWFME